MRIYVNIVNSTASCLGSNLVHVLEAIDASLWYVVSRARRPLPKGSSKLTLPPFLRGSRG